MGSILQVSKCTIVLILLKLIPLFEEFLSILKDVVVEVASYSFKLDPTIPG